MNTHSWKYVVSYFRALLDSWLPNPYSALWLLSNAKSHTYLFNVPLKKQKIMADGDLGPAPPYSDGRKFSRVHSDHAAVFLERHMQGGMFLFINLIYCALTRVYIAHISKTMVFLTQNIVIFERLLKISYKHKHLDRKKTCWLVNKQMYLCRIFLERQYRLSPGP